MNRLRTYPAAATLADVAREAGVSLSTASRVLNGKRGAVPINEKTRENVLRVARELAYTPNAAARALTSRRTHTIGVVCYHIGTPDVPPFVEAVEATALAQGYRIIFCSTLRGTAQEASDVPVFLSLLQEKRVDAMIIFSDLVAGTAGYLERLRRAAVPIALVSCDPRGDLDVRCEFEYYAGGRAIADHLVGLGHRRVVFLAGDATMHTISSDRRLSGLRDGLTEGGANLMILPQVDAPSVMEAGRLLVPTLLERHPDATAAVTRNDAVALGALQALGDAGVAVPREFSLVGFGDYPYSAYLRPPLTTLQMPVAEAGRRVTEALIAAIGAERTETVLVRLEPRLVVRGSTGLAPVTTGHRPAC